MTLSYKPVHKQFLIEPEIKKLLSKRFDNERLKEVRDIFAFQCFIGIAYIDVVNLTTDNIYENGFRQKWLCLNRQKSDVEANIPSLEILLSIIHKYIRLDSDKLLLMHTNQKINVYLK